MVLRRSMGPSGRHYRQPTSVQRFFKIILPNTIQEKKLRLPMRFVRRYGDELSNVAKLIVPNGPVWQVGLRKERKDIWFNDGWHDFLEYYSICYGYFLVFKYRGMSNFSVFIFNKSTCEIEYPCDELPRNNNGGPSKRKQQQALFSGDEMEEEEEEEEDDDDDDDDEFENLGYNPHSSTSNWSSKKKDSRNWSSKKKEFRPSFGTGNLGINKTVNKNITSKKKRKFQQEFLKKGKKCKMEQDSKFFLNSNSLNKDRIGLSKECQEEIEIYTSSKFNETLIKISPESRAAVEAAIKTKPKNPSFLIVFREHNITNNTMIVPAAFAGKYLHRNLEIIKVEDCDGKEWIVKSLWYWRGRNLSLRSGWDKFFRDNCLGDGDVCLFELIHLKNANVALKVSVFHV